MKKNLKSIWTKAPFDEERDGLSNDTFGFQEENDSNLSFMKNY